MSTSPEPASTEDRLIGVLSRWLGRGLPNEQLRKEIEEIGTAGLAPAEAAVVDEVLAELENASPAGRAQLERVVRETIEALALGI
jgi:hypothetical protein